MGSARGPFYFILSRNWPEFFALAALVFVAVNGIFASLYFCNAGAISNARPGSFEDTFYFSVQTMATIGYGVMSPSSRFGHVVVVLEAFVGMNG